MSNPLEKIGHGLKVAGEDVLKGLEFVGHVGEDVFHLLSDARTLTPAFKSELSVLVQDIEPLAAQLAPIIAERGMNVALDIASIQPLIADIKKTVLDFVSFLPTLKKAIEDIKADVD